MLEVLEGYAGRGGAPLIEPFEPECLCSTPGTLAAAFADGGDLSRSFSRTADECADGAKWDFLLLCSIMLIAHASRSTGVRFAA